MTRFGCILLVFFILSCGNNSTGPEIEPDLIPNHEAGDLIIDLPGGAKMAFIWVEPGTLTVVTARHRNPLTGEITGYALSILEIPTGYYLGKYELTQQQWEQVMHTSPWATPLATSANIDSIGPNFPAYISWHDAQAYVEKLTTLQNDSIYRLPTGSEWVYASRAGAITSWFFGNRSLGLSDYAWWEENADGPQIVGTKLPNPWGFYDIYGNVWEWTSSCVDWFPSGISCYIQGGSYDASTVDTNSIGHILANTVVLRSEVGVRILREGPKISQP